MQSKILETIGIDPAYILIAILSLIIILFVIILIMLSSNKNKLKKMTEKYEHFMQGSDGESLEASILEKFDDIDSLKDENLANQKRIRELNENLQIAYQKVGLVKYDAFKEMGGTLSFALALLNKENTGFILNAMHSRDGCYTYIKEIIKGESYIVLAEEEKEALNQAVSQDKLI